MKLKKEKRISIPKRITTDVMLKSQGYCYCGKKGNQIHHLDEDRTNNSFDNLVLLCFNHHDDASVKGGLSKRLNPAQIKQRRNELYKKNEAKNQIELKHYQSTLKKITDETLFKSSFDAIVVLDILKIKDAFFQEDDWNKKEPLLSNFYLYSNHSSLRITAEIFNFCDELSYLTRAGMPASVSNSILSLIINYFPHPNNLKENKVVTELAKQCGHIALGIIYDASIYLNNMAVVCSGLRILKYLYLKGEELKLKSISIMVLKRYKEIEDHLDRPERNDLENAKYLLKIFKDDLKTKNLGYPTVMKKDMFKLIESHR